MTPTIVDASLAIWDFLKTDDLATALRAMVVDGASNILESGDVTESVLSSAVSTRRASGNGEVLVVSVQDAGERPDTRYPGHFLQFVVIRVYDRSKGYRYIRTARVELMELLGPANFKKNLASGLGRGVLSNAYNDRTGHRWDPVSAVEYEAISYAFRIVKQEG